MGSFNIKKLTVNVLITFLVRYPHQNKHNDSQRNKNQYTDTQYNNKKCDNQYNTMLSVEINPYLLCYYAECRYAECHYVECRGAHIKTGIDPK